MVEPFVQFVARLRMEVCLNIFQDFNLFTCIKILILLFKDIWILKFFKTGSLFCIISFISQYHVILQKLSN